MSPCLPFYALSVLPILGSRRCSINTCQINLMARKYFLFLLINFSLHQNSVYGVWLRKCLCLILILTVSSRHSLREEPSLHSARTVGSHRTPCPAPRHRGPHREPLRPSFHLTLQVSYVLWNKRFAKDLECAVFLQSLIVQQLYKPSLSKFKTCKWPTYAAPAWAQLAGVAYFDFGT